MKKIFFSLLAIAAIASCAKTEDVFTEGDSEIKLSPVTALQTKSDATGKPNFTGSVDGIVYPVQENFDVYAYWKNVPAGEKFVDGAQTFLTAGTAGVEFTNKGNYWGGVLDYYWPKNGSLRFSAYSPSHLAVQHDLEKDCYTIENYQQPNLTDKTWDFLVAPTSPSYSLMTATEKVAIEFQHALSWLTLNVQAKDAAAANKFEIKKVTINNVNTVADFAAEMANGIQFTEWSNPEIPAPYVVFEGSQTVTEDAAVIETTPKGTIIIPQHTTTVTIEFTQYGVNGTPDMEGMVVNLDLILDGSEPWEPGKHYIYNLIFGLDKILINPSVADWKDVEVGELEADATSNVSTEAQLKAALLKGGKIVFQADLAGQYEVNEVDGKTIIIDGNDHKFDGTFTIVGNSTYGEATTVFKNIHFETADASAFPGASFIWSDSQDAPTRYPDNVTITNCTFNATGAAKHAAVGAKFRQLEGDVVIEDTEVEGMHSLLQIQSASKTDVSVSGVKMNECKNGLSLDDAWRTTIRNSEISTSGYGVRAKGCKANTTIEKSKIQAKQPVIVRYVTVDGYVLNVDDKTELIPTTSGDYQIIFTKVKDDLPYEAPTATFTLNAATTYKVFPTPAGWVTTAAELAAALTADKEHISVVLTEDIALPISSLGTITPGSGEYKLGSENTETITIDLNGKKLTINTTYWSVLGAKNDDALFTIKNGTMTSEQATGTWNSYDLSFANCNYDIENVKFEKAIAFSNDNKHVTLKKVTITESHDYYAMWITAEGQNVNIDGLTINSEGRGIKIDEQYVGTPKRVYLNIDNADFNTKKKAAILVKSVAGATITLGSDVDITGTPDATYAVWVDADAAAYYDLVTVTGGNKDQE